MVPAASEKFLIPSRPVEQKVIPLPPLKAPLLSKPITYVSHSRTSRLAKLARRLVEFTLKIKTSFVLPNQ